MFETFPSKHLKHCEGIYQRLLTKPKLSKFTKILKQKIHKKSKQPFKNKRLLPHYTHASWLRGYVYIQTIRLSACPCKLFIQRKIDKSHHFPAHFFRFPPIFKILSYQKYSSELLQNPLNTLQNCLHLPQVIFISVSYLYLMQFRPSVRTITNNSNTPNKPSPNANNVKFHIFQTPLSLLIE